MKANNSLDRRHNIIDRNENHKGDKTGGKQERLTGAHTTCHGRSAATRN